MPDPKRSGPPQGAAPEISATAKQLDLTTTEDTPPSDMRVRTEPDPAARRRNLAAASAQKREVNADVAVDRPSDGATAVLANTPAAARREAERCLDELAATGQPFDAEDLRARLGGHILGAHPNAMSAVFRMAARQGLIRHVGYRPSTRPEARARDIRVWQGTGVRR